MSDNRFAEAAKMNNKQAIEVFKWIVIGIGIAACVRAAYYLPYQHLNLLFAILATFTVVYGSRLSLQLPRSKVHFSMNDSLIFLTFLMYGGEAAILMATAEAASTAVIMKQRGFLSRYSTIFFNGSLMACTIAATHLAFIGYKWVSGSEPNFSNIPEFVALVGMMALVSFFVNSSLVSIYTALKTETSVWSAWHEKSLGGSMTYIIGAVFAGATYKLIEYFGVFAFAVVGLIVGLVYFTYRRYLGELRTSMEQADHAERERAEAEQRRVEEAEKHIAELNRHIAEQERISEALRVSKERFEHAALHDALTGLPNRTFFYEQIKLLLERKHQDSYNGFCVLFMDLDGFKKINDSLGHAIGDELLVRVAHVLKQVVRQGDTVARLGGDEFAIVLAEIGQAKDAVGFAERVTRAIAQPFRIENHQVYTVPSIGLALSNAAEYETPEEILRDADIAMYDAKENKTGCSIFDRELRVRAVNMIQLETDLRSAVEDEQFRVFYQPIISLDTGSLAGFEALMRWQHPERGLVAPAEFIPIAESNGQVVPMTNWILWQACSQLSRWRWRAAANRSLIISVNLSSKHFTQPDLVKTVKHTLHETGLDPRCLKLEITESAVMQNAEDAANTLQALRGIGVQLSIDDFGTGYSSLSYLHRFPIDTLKVDRSFVMRMGANGENSEIVKTIITLAQNLSLNVIAEGVETIDQLRILRELGCSYGQGFFFAKPLPLEEIDALMRSKTNWLPEGIAPVTNHIPATLGKVVMLPTGRLG